MKTNWFKINFQGVSRRLVEILNSGWPISYCELGIYLTQGVKCKDCKKEYFECECNRCEKCDMDFCLCDLGINFNGYKLPDYTLEQRKLILKTTIEWIIHNLNQTNAIYLINNHARNSGIPIEEDIKEAYSYINKSLYYEN